MFEIKEVTYEEARRKYLEEQMQKAQRSMKYWGSRIDRSRPDNLMDIAHLNASEAGRKYNFYKDALEALEDNKFQHETGFVKGFEAARPKWISVEDRLPEACTEVLVYFDGVIATSEIIMFDMITKDPMWSYTGAGGDPTHWMPLPSAPKEEA